MSVPLGQIYVRERQEPCGYKTNETPEERHLGHGEEAATRSVVDLQFPGLNLCNLAQSHDN